MSAAPAEPPRLPTHDEEQRKRRVLTHGTPSITSTIADAVVLKHGDLFLVTEPDGSVPGREGHGFGLYYHDCRFLNGYELTLAREHPVALGSTCAGPSAVFALTNPDLQPKKGALIPKESLGLRWERELDGEALRLTDRIVVRNWGHAAVELPLELRFAAAFEDVFQVRGLLPVRLGRLEGPAWRGHTLEWRYDGADRITRVVRIEAAPGFEPVGAGGVRAVLRLPARGVHELAIRLTLAEIPQTGVATPPGAGPLPPSRLGSVSVRSDHVPLDRVVGRSFADLEMLRSSIAGLEFLAAGVPWFTTLFGRDSIIAALQVLPYEPGIARHTLRLLAHYQGRRVDGYRDEEPGKILHELRRGEMARTGEIPHSPYYGTVDATPLFLILLGSYVAWTGDLGLFDELRPNVERAFEWMRRFGDRDGDGFIEYRSESKHGLINQGWKDSGDAIVDAAGRIATPPIALVEVQGYAYRARRLMADLYRRCGEVAWADQLSAEADRLYEAFNRTYWVEDLGFYALALEAEKRPLAVVSSNPGHALWCGIVDPARARAVVDRLLAADMFGGWGIRTLSSAEAGYTPIGYHLGTVWPHDNAIIAAGFRRYGFAREAARVFEAIVDAGAHFRHGRLRELFAGFARDDLDVPIRYPVACHPQAWAAGSVPFLLEALLGLEPDALGRRLRVIRPIMPQGAEWLEIEDIRVADARVALRLERRADGGVDVTPSVGEGALDVVLEDGGG